MDQGQVKKEKRMDGSETTGLVKGVRVATREVEPELVDELRQCELRIDNAYDDAWHALKTIHDGKLYRADGYKSFKDYVEQRWGYSKSRAHRLIDHVKICEYLKEQGVETLPTSEAHTQSLTKLRRISKSEEDFLQRAGNAWEKAVDTAPKTFDVPRVTADHVENSMQHFGDYRSVKRQNTSQAAIDLRDLLTRIGQSDAMKMTPSAFAKRFDLKGLPSNAPRIIDWLAEYAEIAGVRD